MPNALAAETSPYLRQHQDNPVDWLPWGEVALRRAREEDKPLLVSIGYSACHWCHVMERESFEDPEVAERMNEHFVCVKVDREERPDVDAIYMEAVQAMTGHGGWPLNVFCTPDQVPFFAGTYFPPTPRPGVPAWPQVLEAMADAWRTRRDEIREQGEQITARLAGTSMLEPTGQEISKAVLGEAVQGLRGGYDSVQGGFGGAPKFPPSSVLRFLLANGEHEMALQTLRSMAGGGINDQIGGGFARYSVDATWTVPHFEKMLYDNALLARAYLHGWLVSGDEVLRRTSEETLEFILRELRGPEGGFYSALDADSEGEEGKFYVWSFDDLLDALEPADAEAAVVWFGATAQGNFEGTNVLESRGPEPPAQQRARIRERLMEVRAERVRPGLDDKRLTAWNALALGALAEAGARLGRDDFLDAARANAEFLLGTMRDAEGRLLRTSDGTTAKLNAYLEDHAFLVEALLDLYEATFEPRWFAAARELADTMIDRFADEDRGGFFSTSADHERLLTRRKDLEDNPIPSGSSSAALGLLRLAALTGEERYERYALSVLSLVHPFAARYPQAFGHLLLAISFAVHPPREVALAGADREPLERVLRERLWPAVVVAAGDGSDTGGVPLLEGRTPVDGRAAAYVCERFACQRPVTGPDELAALLGD
jgi:uncharacterized protein YyaL (SSP411 family)